MAHPVSSNRAIQSVKMMHPNFIGEFFILITLILYEEIDCSTIAGGI